MPPLCLPSACHHHHPYTQHLPQPPARHFLAALAICYTMGRRRRTRAELAAAKEQKEEISQREAAFYVVQNDPIVCDTLERAIHLGDYLASAAPIWQKHGHMFHGKSAHELVNELLSWAGRDNVRPALSPNFERVMQARKSKRSTYHTAKRRLVTYAGLNPSADNKDAFLATIPPRYCARLDKPFPPVHLYVSEDESIFKQNAVFVLERGLPDWRKWRKRIYKLEDPTLLAHDLDPSQSTIFYDKDGIVAVVLRNACGLQSVVQFMDDSVKKVVDSRNNIRVSASASFLYNCLTCCLCRKKIEATSRKWAFRLVPSAILWLGG
jgi:hypothetical protein